MTLGGDLPRLAHKQLWIKVTEGVYISWWQKTVLLLSTLLTSDHHLVLFLHSLNMSHAVYQSIYPDMELDVVTVETEACLCWLETVAAQLRIPETQWTVQIPRESNQINNSIQNSPCHIAFALKGRLYSWSDNLGQLYTKEPQLWLLMLYDIQFHFPLEGRLSKTKHWRSK